MCLPWAAMNHHKSGGTEARSVELCLSGGWWRWCGGTAYSVGSPGLRAFSGTW